ncbi:MAG: tetratricopeptide repeat protein, partial [Magnetococcus sp. YQC-9]
GVVPQLRFPGVVSGVGWWRQAFFRPGTAGGNLWSALAQALLQPDALPELAAGGTAAELGTQWQTAPSVSATAFRMALHHAQERQTGVTANSEGRLVLVVDQLEELFTLAIITAEERNRFVELLEGLARSGQVWVIAAMRSDFFHRTAETPRLRDLATGQGQYHLLPPRSAELEPMIRRPAAAAGLRFELDEESGLGLDAMLHEAAAREPGSLPLLEFTLDELYRLDVTQAGGTQLTLASYRSLGGLDGALAERAEAICGSLGAALSAVLRALVTLQPREKSATARIAWKSEVASTPERAEVLESLVQGRLVVSSGDAEAATVRLAHEALLTRWPRLAQLIVEDRSFLEVRSRLESDSAAWREKEHHVELLLPGGKRLAEAEELLGQRRDELTPEVVAYVETSSRQERHNRERRLRRARWLALTMSGLVVTASWFGWQSHQQGLRADKARGQAEELVNFVIFDLRDRLQPLGRLDLLDQAARKALGYYDQLGDLSQMEQGQQRRMAAALINLGDVLTDQGNLTEALTGYRKAAEISDTLARSDPKNARLQLALAVNHERFGNTFRSQGDLPGALGEYRAGMEIKKRLIAQDPKNAEWQRALFVSHDRLGDILKLQGDLPGALGEYRAGMEIEKRLIAQDPKNAEWQRDLFVSHDRLGDILKLQGDLPGALGEYRAGMEIIERLAAQDPRNAGWQRDLSISHIKLGGIFQAQGDLPAALGKYRAAMEIAKRLVAQDPKNAQWQSDLSSRHDQLGEILQAQGDLPAALGEVRAGMEIAKHLAAQDSQNAEWQKELSTRHSRLGDILKSQGDLSAALGEYRAGMEITQRLAALDPQNAEWQLALSVSHDRLGDILQAQGYLPGALGKVRASMEIMQRLVALDPQNAEWQQTLYVSHVKLGDILESHGDLPRALGEYHAAEAVSRQMIQLAPELAAGYGQLTWSLILQGQFKESREPAQKAHKMDDKSYGWTVNLGHTYLLQEDAVTARQYYLKSLPQISGEQAFTTGPLDEGGLCPGVGGSQGAAEGGAVVNSSAHTPWRGLGQGARMFEEVSGVNLNPRPFWDASSEFGLQEAE